MTPVDQALRHYLELYDEALPAVYSYLRRRVESDATAEDLTAETFLAGMTTVKSGTIVTLTTAWLITVARNKLVDHWRSASREDKRMKRAATEPANHTDPWDAVLDAHLAHETLAALSASHRAALSLRYLDGLPVGAVASHLQRTPGATEALLTRAKAAFRTAYPNETGLRHA